MLVLLVHIIELRFRSKIRQLLCCMILMHDTTVLAVFTGFQVTCIVHCSKIVGILQLIKNDKCIDVMAINSFNNYHVKNELARCPGV